MIHLVVVGDTLLDRDLIGTAQRLCPDAPVPVMEVDQELRRPGGAGLAAVVAARSALDGSRTRVSLVSALGHGAAAAAVAQLLEQSGVELVDLGRGGSTPEKVRLRSGGQSLLRLDLGDGPLIGSPGRETPVVLDTADAILVADYGRGVTSDTTLRSMLSAARERGVPLVWDPHPRGPEPVPGVTVVTPNQTEAAARCGDGAATDVPLDIHRARSLRDEWGSVAVAITRGSAGLTAVTGDGTPLVVPPDRPLTGIDTCGAGDVLAVGVATALGEGRLLSDALHLGVRAAGRYLAAGGATELSSDTMVPASEVTTMMHDTHVESRRVGDAAAPRVVATGGCFDVLHPGHLALLRAARSLGDRLVVLVNSDDSVRRLKGPDRPVHRLADRVAALRALRDVDEVMVFEEDTPERILRQVRPHLFVKGGDYTAALLPESTVMSEWGGAAVTVPYLPGHSTSRLLGSLRPQEVVHVD